MTLEELSKLTPVGKRIKVSELLGWTCCGVVPGQEPHGLPPWRKVSDYSTQDVLDGNVPMNTLPDWAKDLNLCHDFEEALTSYQREEYALRLRQLVPQDENFGPIDAENPNSVDVMGASEFAFCHATAESKVDAFLLTVL